jgi:hypothetical protein
MMLSNKVDGVPKIPFVIALLHRKSYVSPGRVTIAFWFQKPLVSHSME